MRGSLTKRLKKRRREGLLKTYSLVAGLLVLFLCFGVYMLLQIDFVKRTYLYPFPYQPAVIKYAESYGVDTSLAIAVIKAESKFQPAVRSHRGAVGLMQLMPETAEWIAWQIGEEDFFTARLEEPELNIRYGIWYLAALEREFDGNDVLALAAYNAGRGNVHEWIKKNRWPVDFNDITAIPYSETRNYVTTVLKNRDKYKELYNDNNEN